LGGKKRKTSLLRLKGGCHKKAGKGVLSRGEEEKCNANIRQKTGSKFCKMYKKIKTRLPEREEEEKKRGEKTLY